MNIQWTISTEPAAEPITAAEAQAALNVPSGYDDARFNSMISSARKQVEKDLDRALITQTITMTLDHFPAKETIHLIKAPIQEITSFSYLDTNGDSQTLVDGTDYRFTNTGDKARIIPISGWPSVSTNRKEVVTIVFVAGYGDAGTDVPADILEAIKMHIDWQYSKGHITLDNYKQQIGLSKNFFDWNIND